MAHTLCLLTLGFYHANFFVWGLPYIGFQYPEVELISVDLFMSIFLATRMPRIKVVLIDCMHSFQESETKMLWTLDCLV